jgi:hypothetical protein
MLTALFFFLFLFLFVALGFFLSERFQSLTAGFSVVAVLSLLLIGGVALFRKQIRNYILNLVIVTLAVNDKKHETTDETISA